MPRPPHAGAPHDEGRLRALGLAVTMGSLVAHSVVGRHDECRLVVLIEVLEEPLQSCNLLVHRRNVLAVLCRVGPMRVAVHIEAEEVQEEDDTLPM